MVLPRDAVSSVHRGCLKPRSNFRVSDSVIGIRTVNAALVMIGAMEMLRVYSKRIFFALR